MVVKLELATVAGVVCLSSATRGVDHLRLRDSNQHHLSASLTANPTDYPTPLPIPIKPPTTKPKHFLTILHY
jgi:hypothetical protein